MQLIQQHWQPRHMVAKSYLAIICINGIFHLIRHHMGNAFFECLRDIRENMNGLVFFSSVFALDLALYFMHFSHKSRGLRIWIWIRTLQLDYELIYEWYKEKLQGTWIIRQKVSFIAQMKGNSHFQPGQVLCCIQLDLINK